MPITPSPFGTPGGAADQPDDITPGASPSGANGRSAEVNKLGSYVMGTQARVLANEGGTGALVPKAGATMTGPLVLAADPTAALGAAPKQYVDALATTDQTISSDWTFVANATRKQPVVELRAYGAPSGDATGATDTPIVQAWLNDAVSLKGEALCTPGTYNVNSLLLNGATGVEVKGEGGVLNLVGSGTSAPSGLYSGLELRGTLTDVIIRDLIFQGNNNPTNAQSGIWGNDEPTGNTIVFNHVQIKGNKISQTTTGIYFIITKIGSVLNDLDVSDNMIYEALGYPSGEGYGIAIAGATDSVVINNYLEACQRNSIYISSTPPTTDQTVPNPNGIVVAHNRIKNHQINNTTGNQEGGPVSAIQIARVQNVDVHDNIIDHPYNGGITVGSDGTHSRNCSGVSVHDNLIILPTAPSGFATELQPVIYIGDTAPVAGFTTSDINVSRNKILIDGGFLNPVMISNAVGVTVDDNEITFLNPVAANVCIYLDAFGFGTGNANDYRIRRNKFVVGGAVTGFGMTANFLASGISAWFDGNTIDDAHASQLWPTKTITAAASMRFINHDNYTGLTFSGTAPKAVSQGSELIALGGVTGLPAASVVGDAMPYGQPSFREATLRPTGAQVETFSRANGPNVTNAGLALTSGTVFLTAMALPAGLVVSNLAFKSAATALVAGTSPHLWFALYDSNRNQVAVTADQTSPVWAANTVLSLPIATVAAGAATSYTVPTSGLYYIGVMCNTGAGTQPSVFVAAISALLIGIPPILCGTSDVTQTTPPAFPHTAGALAAISDLLYAYI